MSCVSDPLTPLVQCGSMEPAVARLAAVYHRIGVERMHDLPVFNSRLRVEAVDFRDWQGRFVGVLIAPWFMNLVALPKQREDWQAGAVGSKVALDLPSGSYDFDLCLADQEGAHLSLPLFSTVQDFPDQGTVRSVAKKTLRRLFTEPQGKDAASENSGRLTRRALLPGMEGT